MPVNNYPKGQAYVAIGHGGLLKVGRSTQIKRRQFYLRRDFKAKGDELKSVFVCDLIEAAYSVESCLIYFCAARYQQHSGREWFIGGDFDEVVAEAKRSTDKWRDHTYPRFEAHPA
jgi:hypothetical protein